MTFWKRLRYYFVGFGMGIILVIVIFGPRSCKWTMGNEVLRSIGTSQILISDSVRCVLKANRIDEDDIFKIFENEGDVHFGKSKTTAPKMYVIENTSKNFLIKFKVINDTVSMISGVYEGKKADCADADPEPHIFQMPEKTVKRILRDNMKKNSLSASDSVLTQLEQNKIGEGEVYNMIGAGKIDFEKSTPVSRPYPIYFVEFKNYVFKIEMAEERTRILEFVVK